MPLENPTGEEGASSSANALPETLHATPLATEPSHAMELEAEENLENDLAPPEEHAEAEEGSWMEVHSRSRRRKLAKERQLATTSTAPPQTTTPSTNQRNLPRLPPLPRNDFKVIIRPRDSLDLNHWTTVQVGTSLRSRLEADTSNSFDKTILRHNKLRIDAKQNIIIYSTPDLNLANKLTKLQTLRLGATDYAVTAYTAAPDESVKGIVHGIPPGTTPDDILDNLEAPGHEILYARMLGQTYTAVITFAGKRLPFFVYYMNGEMRCTPYRPTRHVCRICLQEGHRADVCPTPDTAKCLTCGTANPDPDHPCAPKCVLCHGEHATAARECPQRLRRPYLPRATTGLPPASGRMSRRDFPPLRTEDPGHRSQPPEHRVRSQSGLRAKRGQSKESARASSQRQPDPGAPKVSWAAQLFQSTTAQSLPTSPPATQNLASSHPRADQFIAELRKANEVNAQLMAQIRQLQESDRQRQEEIRQLRAALAAVAPTSPLLSPSRPLEPVQATHPSQTPEQAPSRNESVEMESQSEPEQSKLDMIMNVIQDTQRAMQDLFTATQDNMLAISNLREDIQPILDREAARKKLKNRTTEASPSDVNPNLQTPQHV